jgi:hypothetical protein
MRHTAMIVLTGLITALLAACHGESKMMLGITGYNYTNRYIDRFSVNGQGGGNVLLSEDDAGGGKTSCCIVLRSDQELPVKVYVEWTYGERWNHIKGIKLQDAKSYSAEVFLEGPTPKDPTIFAVHFYPDNTVQVEVAADYPKPRILRTTPISTDPT